MNWENGEEVSGEVEECLRVKSKGGATKAFYDTDGKRVSSSYHSIERIDEDRFIGE